MDKIKKLQQIRNKLKNGQISIGTWMQIPNSSVAEIISNAGYDWVTIDLEHGSFSLQELPNIFRAIEMTNTLPLARLVSGRASECSQVLDAGAGGLIIPKVNSKEQLENIISYSSYPPHGNRGVGYSRANLFGVNIKKVIKGQTQPLIIAQIEHFTGIENLNEIISVENLDALFIGPYDLSASLGITGDFNNNIFKDAIETFENTCKKFSMPFGIHVVEPKVDELNQKIKEGYNFIAYSTDAYFLYQSSLCPPTLNKEKI